MGNRESVVWGKMWDHPVVVLRLAAAWSSGMIRPSGGRGPEFDSRSGPNDSSTVTRTDEAEVRVCLLYCTMLCL